MKWTDQEQRRIDQARKLGDVSPQTVQEKITSLVNIQGIGTPIPSFDQSHGPTQSRRKKDKIRFRLR